MAFSETYELRRSGDSISFPPPDPFDWPSFTAKLNGPMPGPEPMQVAS